VEHRFDPGLADSFFRRADKAILAALQKKRGGMSRGSKALAALEEWRIEAFGAQENPATSRGRIPGPTAIPSSKLIVVGANSVEPEEVCWLWPNRFPLGKLSLLGGDPGLGKSTVLIDIAARVTTGTVFPDGAPCERGGVVILSAEDGMADTIVPRLMAAGANRERVGIVRGVQGEKGVCEFILPDHLDQLRETVAEYDARLVMVDPLAAYLSAAVNSWRDHDARRALRPLADFAEGTGAAVIGNRHLTKGGGGKAIYRGGGSIAFSAAARAEFLIAEDPEDAERRIVAQVKANLAPPQPSMAYRLVATPSGVARVEWLGTSTHNANDLVAGFDDPAGRGALADAREFLLDALADGPMPVNTIQTNAKQAGHAWSTIRRAKESLKVRKHRMGFGPGGSWSWELPPPPRYEDEERAALAGEDACLSCT
jgi:hypothetical protein